MTQRGRDSSVGIATRYGLDGAGIESQWGPTTSLHILCVVKYEGWNFNFGNTPLDWIQELLE